jgi:hypothetical protein
MTISDDFSTSFDNLKTKRIFSIEIMVKLPFHRFFECIFVVENLYHIIFYMFQVQFDFPDEYLDVKVIKTNSEKFLLI